MSVAFWSIRIGQAESKQVEIPEGYVLNLVNAAVHDTAGNADKHAYVLHAKTTSIENDEMDAVLCTLRPKTTDQVPLQLVFGWDVPTSFSVEGSGAGAVYLSGYFQPGPEEDNEEDDEDDEEGDPVAMEALRRALLRQGGDDDDEDDEDDDDEEETKMELAAKSGKMGDMMRSIGRQANEPEDDEDDEEEDEEDDEDEEEEDEAPPVKKAAGPGKTATPAAKKPQQQQQQNKQQQHNRPQTPAGNKAGTPHGKPQHSGQKPPQGGHQHNKGPKTPQSGNRGGQQHGSGQKQHGSGQKHQQSANKRKR